MWRFALVLTVATALAQTGPSGPTSSCIQCHKDLEGEQQRPAAAFAVDVHAQKGLSCHSCHGGDPTVGVATGGPEDAMSRAKGYIGKPEHKKIASLCASCHSNLGYMRRFNPQARVDQYAEYLTSVHGKRNARGDPNVATCTDCHGVHGIKAVSDPNAPVYPINVAETCGRCHADKVKMAPYSLPVDQLVLYSKSVHGEALLKNRDLAAPTCNDCHGNHGAAPPGVDSVANVCGQCHVSQWDLFMQSPHKNAFAESQLPACVTCHNHHDIARASETMIGVAAPSVCVTCHDEGSAGFVAAAKMRDGLARLQQHLDAAREILARAERAGMEVSGPIYELNEGKDRLVRARVEIHRFNLDALNKRLDEGEKIAAAGELAGRKALEDLAFRRKGLAVSVVILVCMMGLVILKIRQYDRRRTRRP